VRRWAKSIGLTVLVLWLACQLVPANRRNPGFDQSKTIYATENVPPAVKSVLERSCRNCHSNETSWPWYSYVAPASWVIAHDVHQARKAMNFSEWGSYAAKRKEEKLEDICEQLTNGDMPDPKYALFHRSARTTQEERVAVCQWTEDSRQY
jgi:RNA polymerase subunit RPABC4/transcription elongation factor Spt4